MVPLSDPSELGHAAVRVEIDADHGVGTYRRLVVVVWRHETRAAAVARVGRALKELSAQTRGPVGLLQVVEPTASPPGAEAKQALAHMLKTSAGTVACSALAYLGGGVKMAAARAFITGVAMLSRPAFPHVVFPTVEEAAEWHVKRLGDEAARAAKIASAVAEIAAAIDAGKTG
jgi:hypothetical protein